MADENLAPSGMTGGAPANAVPVNAKPVGNGDAGEVETVQSDLVLTPFSVELSAIMDRREKTPNDTLEETRASLAGLALSGGGIRSATFALGALQELAKRDALGAFDYLSTVSGGGFTGGWWSAWLSRAERKNENPKRLFPEPEILEPARVADRLTGRQEAGVVLPTNRTAQPEGSLSVQLGDAIHHLRLFANYLTPRTGLLSGDTWRAVTIISRNVLLTWAVLLPVLMSVILTLQLYFVGREDVGMAFACSRPDSVWIRPRADKGADTIYTPRVATSAVCLSTSRAATPVATPGAQKPAANSAAQFALTHSHTVVVQQRLWVLADPLISFAIVFIVCTMLWMLFGSGSVSMTGLSFVLVILLTVAIAVRPSAIPGSMGEAVSRFEESRWLIFTAIVILVVGRFGLRPWLTIHRGTAGADQVTSDGMVPRDAVRNTIVRWQARVLLGYAVLMVGLLLSAFGHEVVWYLFEPQTGTLWASAQRAGGWIALLTAAASTAFTLVKAFPSPRGHDAFEQEPSMLSRIAMTIAPILALMVLGVACAAVGHAILSQRGEWGDGYRELNPSTAVAFISALILTGFTCWEQLRHPSQLRKWSQSVRAFVISVSALLLYLAFVVYVFKRSNRGDHYRDLSYATIILAVASVVWQWSDFPVSQGERRAVGLGGVIAGIGVYLYIREFTTAQASAPTTFYSLSFGLLCLLTLAMLTGWVLYGRMHRRAVMLGTIAVCECGALLLLHHMPQGEPVVALRATAIGWASFFVAWVVALGWTIDPNLTSLHNFYKARIARAYLGASNERKRKGREISEMAPGDDIPLKSVDGHTRGAPLHLVNATLNLVGGRELATAQRSAALFTMSSLFCGSARTGYRPTKDYMGGTLSLGSAVAASGAAVSPTMGAKSVSAPLALMLALFNVRLGFWAPTPNRDRWKETQPTLWPFYLLSEAFSQTNDLGTYCYLTDGGHFDNTAVYALIERGCRYIYVLDDGADPKPCFSDMGELIRRCRIDFGAEIKLADGISAFRRDASSGLGREHFVVGTIDYTKEHLAQIGWQNPPANHQGQILWIKPTVTEHNSVDLRQYRMENAQFPQQTTLDQWYDEAQFESYRALGQQSMKRWLDVNGLTIKAERPESLFPSMRPAARTVGRPRSPSSV